MAFLKSNSILFLVFFLLSFNGCSDYFEDLSNSCQYHIKKEKIDPQQSSLIGNWKYEGFYKQGDFTPTPDDVNPVSPEEKKPYVIKFKENGDLHGFAENSLTFESFQEYESGAIRFQNFLGGTERGTKHPWWENHMVEALENAKCYELDKNENKLHITSANENGEKITMKFRRIEN